MATDVATLTVDFEFFTHTPAYRRSQGTIDDTSVGLSSLDFLNRAYREYDAKATYFVVGDIATNHPDAISRIAENGHEIGSHSYSHRLLSTLSDRERHRELNRSRIVLREASGQTVRGFRSPAFETPPEHFEMVAAAGYDYDSSIAPSRHIPGWYGGDHEEMGSTPASIVDPSAPDVLTELPIAVMPKLRLPLTGAWVRFFGRRYAAIGMHALASRDIPPVLHIHPWELVDLPKVKGVPKRVYWRTGEWMRRTVEYLLDQPFEFVTAGELVRNL